MKFVTACACALAFTATAAKAQVYDVIVGGGTARCSDLIAAKAFYVDHPNMQWLVGYLSGAVFTMQAFNQYGSANSTVPKNFQGADPGFLAFRAEVHCKAHPERELWQVANDIIVEYK